MNDQPEKTLEVYESELEAISKLGSRTGGIILISMLVSPAITAILYRLVDPLPESTLYQLISFSGAVGRILIVMIMARYRLGWRPQAKLSRVGPEITFLEGFLLTIMAYFVHVCCLVLNVLPIELWGTFSDYDLLGGVRDNSLLLISVVFVFLLLEEIEYREIYLKCLLPHGTVFSITTLAIVFGLAHGDVRIFHAATLGFLAGILYVVTGTLLWPVLLHFLINSGVMFGGLNMVFPDDAAKQYLAALVIAVTGIVILYLWGRKNNRVSALLAKCTPKVLWQDLKRNKQKYQNYFLSPGMVFYLLITIPLIIYSVVTTF